MTAPAMESATGIPPGDLSAAGIHLDPAEAAQHRADIAAHAHTRTFPVLRVVGFHLLLIGVVVHNRLVFADVGWRPVLLFTLVMEVYCFGSWLLLNRYYRSVVILGRWTLADVFFSLDMLVLTYAVYVSGGERSWLFFILLMRVGDHVHGGVRPALFYAHLAVACYTGLLLYLGFVEHRPLDLNPELAKLILLYMSGLYLALTAGPAVNVRRRNARAVKLATDLIAQLADKTAQLAEEKRRAEEARRQALRASEYKTVLLSRVSHEFRTPLNHILGFAQILEMDELSEAQRESVEQISNGGQRLLGLVDGVLDISAAESGGLELRLEPIELAPVIERVIEEARTRAAQRDITVKAIGLYDVNYFVRADRERLLQVVQNLVTNAIQYNRQGGEVDVIAEMASSGQLRLSVRDTGRGIARDRLPSLFLPFERRDASDVSKEGRGLGLVLAKALVESMDGLLTVRSELGFGSTFIVELPLVSDGSPTTSGF
jgi:signal transduction histidine kinase